jgi:hypothetical protein
MEQFFEVYEQWNAALAKAFFAPASSQKLLYLDANEAIWEELGKQVAPKSSNPKRHFVSSVRQTLALNSTDIFRRHDAELKEWVATGIGCPPFIGLLVLFVLAAEEMVADEQYSASNYYSRLSDLLSISCDKEKTRLQNQFRKRTPVFWQSLNEWLNINNGMRGLPTAYGYGANKYISVPISQALVREADRRKLPEFFNLFGLQPGQLVPTNDMESLLGNWISQSGIGSNLKRIWGRSAEARSRISDVVSQELTNWEGNDDEGEVKQRQLLLACECTLTPVLSLTFHLIANVGEGFVYGEYQSAKECIEDIRTVFGQETVQFDHDHSIPFAILDSESGINLDVALTRSYKFFSEGNALSIARQWKPLLVLVHESNTRLFVEKKRVELGKRHIIIVYQYLVPAVREHLSEIAAGELTEKNHSDDPNIPFGFTAFIDVTVQGVRPTSNEDIQCLEPVELTTIILDSGFALPIRNTWLSRHPPSIKVLTLREGKHQAKLERLNLSGSSDKLQEFCFENSLTINVEALELRSGTYRVTLFGDKGSSLLSRTLKFREVGQLASKVESKIVRNVGASNLFWVLSGEETPQDLSTSIVGASVPNVSDCSQVGQYSGPMPMIISKGAIELDQQTSTTSSGEGDALQSRHVHLWRFPHQKKGKLVLGKCLECGAEQWAGRGSKKTKKSSRGGRNIRLGNRPVVSGVVPIDSTNQLKTYTMDDTFEAMIVLGKGSFAQARSLIETGGIVDRAADQSLNQQTDEWLRNLSALGHIETINDTKTGRISYWEVTSPKVVVINDNHAFLTGARTLPLIREIEDEVIKLGGSVEKTSQILAPTKITIRALRQHDIETLGSELSFVANQRTPIAVLQPSRSLLAVLPLLEDLLVEMDSRHWPIAESLEFFDTETIRWSEIDFPDRPGCYRFQKYKRQYFVIDRESFRSRRGLVCDYRLAKHLGGFIQRRILMAFDSDRSSVFVPLGCELPALYERVLCLESGFAPNKEIKQGYIEYREVTEDIARGVYARLGGATNLESQSAR